MSVQTICLSIGVGTACTMFAPGVVLEALVITAAIVIGLTAYAFWASRRGKDFTFLGPILISSTPLTHRVMPEAADVMMCQQAKMHLV